MRFKIRQTQLKELVMPVSTWNPNSSDSHNKFTYIDVSSLDSFNKCIAHPSQVLPSDAPSRARQLVQKHDVLISTVRPNLNAVALVEKCSENDTASTGICVLRADKGIISHQYLFHWVRTPYFIESMVKKATGASYPAVSTKIIKDSFIPLPPLEEQKRIAAILDKADAIRRKRQRALKLADEFLRSVFLDMFGDPVTNPKEWDIARLDEQAQIIGGGTPSKKNADFYKGKICWASSKDIKNKYLFDTIDHITSEAIEKSSTKLVNEGTILIVVKSKILARKVPITILKTNACFNQDIKGIIPTVASHNIYLAYHFMMFEKTLLSLARGVNTEGLTLDHLKNLEIMLPPENLIKQFTAIAQKHFKHQQQYTSIMQNTESLFASLQQKAFRGEL